MKNVLMAKHISDYRTVRQKLLVKNLIMMLIVANKMSPMQLIMN